MMPMMCPMSEKVTCARPNEHFRKEKKRNKLKGNFRGVTVFIRAGRIVTHDPDDVSNARVGRDNLKVWGW